MLAPTAEEIRRAIPKEGIDLGDLCDKFPEWLYDSADESIEKLKSIDFRDLLFQVAHPDPYNDIRYFLRSDAQPIAPAEEKKS